MSRPSPSRRPRRLTLEPLADRLAPVVGAFAPAPIAETGVGFDGVVRIVAPNGSSGSGSLLQSGRHILTAAHVVDANGDGKVDPGTFRVTFTTASGTYWYTVSAANVAVAPGWTGSYKNAKDLALLTLPDLAPADADRYRAYYSTAEVGKEFVEVGYGMIGTGAGGEQPNPSNLRTYGHNIFDARGWEADYGGPFKKKVGPYGTLAYDFDNGGKTNAFGHVSFPDEGFDAPGDSGGPLFIDFDAPNGRYTWIAGVVSFGVGGNYDDIDNVANSTFGEVGFATRVSDSAGWVNSSVDLGKYTLVVDMAHQPGGKDGRPDTIEARVEGAEAQIWVNGRLVQREVLTRLSGLQILGTSDADAITVSGTYRVPVSVDGRGGGDQLTVDDSNNTLPATVTVQGSKVGIRTSGFTSQAAVSFATYGLEGLTVYAGHPAGAGNTVTVEDTPANPAGSSQTTIFTGLFDDVVSVRRVSSPTTILGQGGNDTVTVGPAFTVAGIRYALGVTNAAGSTQLKVLASADPARTVVMATSPDLGNYIQGLAPAPILYGDGVRGLKITTGAGADTIDVRYAPVPTTIQTNGEDDQVTVGSTNAGARLTVDAGAGRNRVAIGGPDYGIDGLGGPADVRATGGTNTLVLDDRGEAFATRNTLTGNSFAKDGYAPVTFADVYSLIVYGGQGNPTGPFTPPGNTYEVQGTVPVSRLGASYTSVVTGPGRDTVNVRATDTPLFVDLGEGDLESVTAGGPDRGLDGIRGAVTLFGQAGPGWQLTVDDTGTAAPQAVTFDPDGVRRSGAADITFPADSGMGIGFFGGAWGNTIDVHGKPGNLILNAGAGDDVITLGSADGRLSGLGHVVVNGQGGADTVALNDQGEGEARSYDFLTYDGIPVVTARGTTVVLYDGQTEAVSLNGGQGGDTVTVQDLFPAATVTLQGGAGPNELTGPAGANTWTASGPDAGTLTSDAAQGAAVSFAGFPTLLDPDGDDVFA